MWNPLQHLSQAGALDPYQTNPALPPTPVTTGVPAGFNFGQPQSYNTRDAFHSALTDWRGLNPRLQLRNARGMGPTGALAGYLPASGAAAPADMQNLMQLMDAWRAARPLYSGPMG